MIRSLRSRPPVLLNRIISGRWVIPNLSFRRSRSRVLSYDSAGLTSYGLRSGSSTPLVPHPHVLAMRGTLHSGHQWMLCRNMGSLTCRSMALLGKKVHARCKGKDCMRLKITCAACTKCKGYRLMFPWTGSGVRHYYFVSVCAIRRHEKCTPLSMG